jgi:hypothetical protein
VGPVARRAAAAATLALVVVASLARPAPVAAFSGFGATTADSTYGQQMRFGVKLPGGAPDQLDLLLHFSDSDSTVVVPVTPGASSAQYVWDASSNAITPNTRVTYRWRATNAGVVTFSPESTLLYDDDRPGLDWHSARIGDATVHWYGGSESQARHFGQITANAAAAAEKLLGHSLAGPIDIFVYVSHDDFFGALGPGAREWTGAATYPELRTVFMWLGGGSRSYLDTTVTHEVTHVVFHDATANPFHDPPTWFNEGFSVWSEQQSAGSHADIVRAAAESGDLLAFDGISQAFPIDAQAASLAYSEGATMIQMIIDKYGRAAIAKIAAAWRDGDGDAEALQAGTGITATQLYAGYFASFGVDEPEAVKPAPILPSNVKLPPQPAASSQQPAATGSGQPSASSSPGEQPAGGAVGTTGLLLLGAGAVGVGIGAGVALRRRRSPPGGPA